MTTQIPNSMLVSPGGGLVQSGALAASTTVAPNATAVQTAIAAAAGGGAAAIRGDASPVIQLDIGGNGRAMPLVAGQTINITADITPTIGAGAVLDGVCVADYISSGAGNLLLTNFNARGDTYAAEAGRVFNVTYFNRTAGAFAVVLKGLLLDVIAPTLVGSSVANATPGRIDLTWSEPINPAISAVAAFAISAGHPLTAHTYVDATHTYLTTSTLFVNSEAARTLVYTQPGTNNMRDVAGNLLANITAAAVTNNVAAAPTFVSQTAPGGTIGVAYSYTFAALNTTSFAVFSGTLPAGLALNTATGALTGTPTTAATSSFVISATGPGGATNSTTQSVVITSTAGALSSVAYVPATTKNLTTVGVTDWGWQVSGGVVRRKTSGVGVVTAANFGTGTFGTTTGAVTNTISDGVGGGFATADTAPDIFYQNIGGTAPSGWTWTVPIGTTQQAVELEFGGGTGTLTITPTLSDGSATMAPFTIANGANLGLRFTIRAATAGQSLSVSITSTTTAGGDFIRVGTMVMYPA